jgi:anti-anti-sigma regulatory factor
MSINTEVFKIIDQTKECLRINITDSLTGVEAAALRVKVEEALKNEFDTIYIDVKEVKNADLSGINEVIHSHYTLEKSSKKVVLVYIRGSVIEKWVETTGLDKFVSTAIIPAT